MDNMDTLNLIKRIKALADAGLHYNNVPYDKERFEELREISMQLMSQVSGNDIESLEKLFLPIEDYPTPQVDVRGFILNEKQEVLLVRESVDGLWSLPGGWADIGFTASEVIVKEIKEETGLTASVSKLLAVYDKRCHPHPPQPHYCYKIVFLCDVEDGDFSSAFDIEEVGYFDINELPPLSTERILPAQIKQLYNLTTHNGSTYFD